MRVAIIAHHRSGSTNLSKWLSMELGYDWVTEPYNTDTKYWNNDVKKRYQKSLVNDNIVVKYIYNQFTEEHQIIKTINSFDKLIILTRDNIRECAISSIYVNITKNAHTNYILDTNWLKENEKQIENVMYDINISNNKLKNITEGLQITYEGIFYTKEDVIKLKDYLKLDVLKYVNFIDKKNRYQNNTNFIKEHNKLI
jgi:hypothetical protein